jgi:hypothetical protein
MDNEQLFNILEKLLDELEFCSSHMDSMESRKEVWDYCSKVRNQLFTKDSQLTFGVKQKSE